MPNADDFLNTASEYDADQSLEIGFLNYRHEGTTITDFDLIFILNSDKVNIPRSAYFGEIIEGEDAVGVLSRKRLNEREGLSVGITLHN